MKKRRLAKPTHPKESRLGWGGDERAKGGNLCLSISCAIKAE